MTTQARFCTDRALRAERLPLPVTEGTIALGAPTVGTHCTVERKASRKEMAEVDR